MGELFNQPKYDGSCIHGQKIFQNGILTRCPECHRNAMGGLNQKLVNRFMTQKEQNQYGLK